MSNAKHDLKAAHNAPTPDAPPTPKTPDAPKTKLEQLEAIVETEKSKMAAIAAGGDYAKIIEHLGVIQKSEKDVLDEKNAIAKHEAEIAVKAQRAERIAILDKMLVAYDAYLVAKGIYDASPEGENGAKSAEAIAEYNVIYAAYIEARNPVENALLGALAAKPKPAATATPGTIDLTKTKGKTTEEIVTYYKNAMGADRVNHTPAHDKRIRKELVDKGYNDGTVGNALIAYRREIGVA